MRETFLPKIKPHSPQTLALALVDCHGQCDTQRKLSAAEDKGHPNLIRWREVHAGHDKGFMPALEIHRPYNDNVRSNTFHNEPCAVAKPARRIHVAHQH